MLPAPGDQDRALGSKNGPAVGLAYEAIQISLRRVEGVPRRSTVAFANDNLKRVGVSVRRVAPGIDRECAGQVRIGTDVDVIVGTIETERLIDFAGGKRRTI